jgi:hypothetical protein
MAGRNVVKHVRIARGNMLHKEVCISLLKRDFSQEDLEKLDAITLNELVIFSGQWDCATCKFWKLGGYKGCSNTNWCGDGINDPAHPPCNGLSYEELTRQRPIEVTFSKARNYESAFLYC